MKVEIRFETEYRYPAPVSFSTHLYRLFPRAGRDVLVRRASFETNPGALVNLRRDLFDNEIAACEYPGESRTLTARLLLEVELLPRNPFSFILPLPALNIPFAYEPEQASVLAAYLAGEPAPELAFWQPPEKPVPTIETLVALNSALRENLAYERRDEGVARLAEETARIGGGACRDYAVLLASILRRMGIAARLVSGYHVETGSGERRAEGAMHAWTEAYLPGAGWLGLDPTNGILCDERHLATAVGLTPMDVAPTLGSFFPKQVSSQMSSTLQVREL